VKKYWSYCWDFNTPYGCRRGEKCEWKHDYIPNKFIHPTTSIIYDPIIAKQKCEERNHKSLSNHVDYKSDEHNKHKHDDENQHENKQYDENHDPLINHTLNNSINDHQDRLEKEQFKAAILARFQEQMKEEKEEEEEIEEINPNHDEEEKELEIKTSNHNEIENNTLNVLEQGENNKSQQEIEKEQKKKK